MSGILPFEIHRLVVRIEELKKFDSLLLLHHMDKKRTIEGEQIILNKVHDYLAEMCCEMRILQNNNSYLNNYI